MVEQVPSTSIPHLKRVLRHARAVEVLVEDKIPFCSTLLLDFHPRWHSTLSGMDRSLIHALDLALKWGKNWLELGPILAMCYLSICMYDLF